MKIRCVESRHSGMFTTGVVYEVEFVLESQINGNLYAITDNRGEGGTVSLDSSVGVFEIVE